MCLAIPGKIIAIDEAGPLRMSTVDFGGIRKPVCVEWLPGVSVGEYVIVHVGCAISRIDEKEALATLNLLREMDEFGRELGEPER